MKTIFENKFKIWSISVVGIAILGILLILYDRFFNSQMALNIGVIFFSLAGIMVGVEAILRRRIVLRSPYHKRLSETYVGITAIAQGLLIILTGCLLIGLLVINYLNAGQNLFQHFVRHPGIPFLVFSFICFLTALSIGIGSLEEKQGSKFTIILNLLTNRILGSTILVLIGIIFLGLGLLEIINPTYFDSIGGGFLEVLFPGKTG